MQVSAANNAWFVDSGLSLWKEQAHPGKKLTSSPRICITHSEEPRVAESDLRLPNETDYSFGDFVARNTSYCDPLGQKDSLCATFGTLVSGQVSDPNMANLKTQHISQKLLLVERNKLNFDPLG